MTEQAKEQTGGVGKGWTGTDGHGDGQGSGLRGCDTRMDEQT